LTKGGPVPVTVAGALVAVGGAAVLVATVAGVVRRSRRWVRPLHVLGALVLVLLAVDLVAIPVAVTTVPVVALGSRTPADVGLRYDDVRLRTTDGIDLAAWYVRGSNGGAVVLRHGSGSTRTSALEHAAALAAHGFGVLLVDARGHGASGGRAMDLGWYGDADIDAAVTWLDARPEVRAGAIGVVGLSMGGEEAIGAAGSDARIAAVVAEGVTGRVADDHGWLSDAHGVRGALQEVLDHASQAVTDVLTAASPPPSLRRAVAGAAPRPFLVIAAGDVADEVAAGEWLRSAAPSSVSLWVVPDSGHTGGLDTDPRGWEERVTGFLTSALDLGGTSS
jgi:pimeloyl-ACP methyl ester carboxylesterase